MTRSVQRRLSLRSRLRRVLRRRAMVLLIVLVTVSLLALGGLSFSELMLAEREGVDMSGRLMTAAALADSGVEAARYLVSLDSTSLEEMGGWYDNPDWFSGVLVQDSLSPQDRGYFSVVAPDTTDSYAQSIRFGLENESAKLNINSVLLADKYAENGGRTVLMALPGMTEDVADAILDWLDADDEPREFGAEIEYYGTLDPPYAPKNGPLETIEELLLVRGVTPALLFGADTNRNGIIDDGETYPESLDSVDVTASLVDPSDPSMMRGWAAYLTLYGMELNVRPDGSAKIDLNSDDLETLYDQLYTEFGPVWAAFIVGYRQSGPYTGNDDPQPMTEDVVPDLSKPAKFQLNSVLDLIGVSVRMNVEGEDDPVVFAPVFPDEPLAASLYLPTVMDNMTANSAQVLAGRININEAPDILLYGIPNMPPDVVDGILSMRPLDPESNDDPNYQHETWLYTEGLVSLDEMKQLMPFVTCGGSVYKAQVVGYFEQRGPAVRVEAIIDATVRPARVLFWRDLSHLGRGFSVETLQLGY